MGLKPDQRPYMGKDHIWDSTQCDRETGPKDHRIQHSWDRETRPKKHIWAKTIYGIETGPKTIYGQRPYMGFNTVRQGNRPKNHRIQQGNQTQRPLCGIETEPKTIYGIETKPKTIYGIETKPKTIYGIETKPKTIYGIQHSETGKPTQRS